MNKNQIAATVVISSTILLSSVAFTAIKFAEDLAKENRRLRRSNRFYRRAFNHAIDHIPTMELPGLLDELIEEDKFETITRNF